MMVKRAFSTTLTTILLFFSSFVASTQQEDTKTEIFEASEVLFNPAPSATKEKLVDSLCRLLDVAASTTTASEYKQDIKYRIDVAKELFEDDSLFNEKARQYLSFAYRMMTNGKKYQRPEELDVFVTPAEAQEKATKYGKTLVERAVSELEDGNPGETARLLLELVLMVVTPISG